MTLRGLLHRLRVLIAPASYAREVDEEIRLHLELDAMQARTAGLSAADAESLARKQFGNVTYVREEVRRMSGMELIDRVRQDLGYALRGLGRTPGFTLAVVLTLGLGLGVNAAMFTFLDRVFVKPPAALVRPDEVRRIYADMQLRDEPDRIASSVFRYPHIREIARSVDSTTRIGVFTSFRDSVSITAGSRVVSARRTLANTAYFTVLGIRPLLGRYFDALEDRIETPASVAVISHSLWKRAFDSDPRAIGSVIRVRNRPITVVGVAGEGFAGIDLDRSDLWMPISHYNTDPPATPAWYDSYRNNFALVMRFENAAAEQRFVDVATRVYQKVRIPRYGFDTTGHLRTGPILAAVGPERKDKEISISLRLGGVALIVLLISIANVSNLLLLRTTRRGREIAIRRALGVSRWRLLGQLVTESMVLAALSGVVSIVLTVWAGSALRGLLLPRVSWSTGVVDLRAVGFAAMAALIVGMVVGLAPAFQAWRPDVIASLKAGSKSGAYRRSRLRSALLVAQAALSVVLLVGAGLFVRSLRNVEAIDLGYDAARILTATATAENRDFSSEVSAVMPALLQRIAAIDGVESVASASVGPMRGHGVEPHSLPGRDSLPKVGGERGASFINVSAAYFRASGMRVLEGRTFSDADPSGLVVGEALAKAWWPTESAVGKCITTGQKTGPCVPVIGVVESVHSMGLFRGQMAQYYVSRPGDREVVVIRAEPALHARISKVVSDEMQRLVPQAEQIRMRSLMTDLEPEFRPWRLGATLFTAMGLLSLLVASIGMYSVIAYAVSQRTNEMGIRIAMGAQMADIARLVIGDGLRTVAIGIGLGVVLSIAGGKLVASVLYDISPRDPWVIGAAALALGVIGLAASIIPGLRAARVNPVTALRVD